MTPPRSTKKKRLLPNDIFMSPQKPDTTLTKEKSKELVVKEEQSDILDEFKEIREGVLDMMKDDEEDEVSREVSYLLDRLGKPEEPDESVKEESKMIKPLNLGNKIVHIFCFINFFQQNFLNKPFFPSDSRNF